MTPVDSILGGICEWAQKYFAPHREPTRRRGYAPQPLSKFDAPPTVQVHADWQPDRGRIVLHLVNYNRNEETEKEAPIAVDTVGIDLRLPVGRRVTDVRFLTPGVQGEAQVEFTQSEDRLRLHSPGFLVYGLIVVEFKDG